jgi:LPS export ABC transporter protein LptC
MKKLIKFVTVSYVILVIVTVIVGCSAKVNKVGTPPYSGYEDVIPDYILQDVTHYHYEEGVLVFEVVFQRGEYYASADELYIENCNFIYYDMEGNVISRGSSENARVYSSQFIIKAENNVVVVSEENSCVLETEYLEWRGADRQFNTEKFVTITRENGDTISGRGMVADLALSVCTITSDVRGSFQ